MSLNLTKTKIIVFRNGGIVKDAERWFYNGNEIEVVSLYKYLGLLYAKITTKTKELLAGQAKKAAYSILGFQKQKKFGHFTPADAFKLFATMVKPIACYGAEI